MDPVDERILSLLVQNARSSYRELGETVGLSANAVAQRMRRLEDAGTIRGYSALVVRDDDGLTALVHLRTAVDVDAGVLERRLEELPQVVEILDLAGVVDYEVRVRCRDATELHALLQRIRLLPGVTAMETRPVLRSVLRR